MRTETIRRSKNIGKIDSRIKQAYTFDNDTSAVINAILATGAVLTETQKRACNDRIKAMKSNGVWTKRIAYYGFLGSTAAAHAINWKTPGTYNIIWNGTVIHSANGTQSDGSTGYGNSNFNPVTYGLGNRSHLSAYSRTVAPSSFQIIAGSFDGSGYIYSLQLRRTDNFQAYDGGGAAPEARVQVSGDNSQGYFIGSNDNGNAFLQKNASILATKTLSGANFSANMNRNLYLLCLNTNNVASDFSTVQLSSIGFGLGLTTSEAATDYLSEQVYQTALNRQV